MTALLLVFLAGPASFGDPVLGTPSTYRVTFRQEVGCESVSGSGSIRDVEVRAAIPASDERQTIADLRFDPAPTQRIRDEYGNELAVWRVAEMAPGARANFEWSCKATLRTIEHRVDRAKLGPASEAPEEIRKAYLGGGRKYGLDDAALIEAAAELRAEPGDALDLAFRTNEYIRERLHYENDSRWDDAPVVLRNGHGSCSEYNFLFVSLCRLNGIPARFVGATARRTGEDTYVDTVHHRWSEVWLTGYGWYPVDVSRNDGEDGAPVNQWFGRTSDQLLVLMKGEGGEKAPLAWGYVADVDHNAVGDGRITREKQFLWESKPAGAAGAKDKTTN